MYITVEAFMKCVPHYLQLTKSMDVYIEDTAQMTVWLLRCQRPPLLSRFSGRLPQPFRKKSDPTYAMQGI